MTVTDRLRRSAYLLVLGLAMLGLTAACVPMRLSSLAGVPAGTHETPTAAATATPERPVGTAIGMQAPDFELETLDGTPVRLSDYRGQVVLLYFWATWCGACRMELPGLLAVHERYREKGLTIVGVNLLESKERVQSFVDGAGMEFPVLLDSRGRAGNLYGAHSIPTNYFLDRDGVVRQVVRGAIPEEMIIELVEPLLGS